MNQMINCNPVVKEKFSEICSECGTNPSDVLSNFMQSVIKSRKIPNFDTYQNYIDDDLQHHVKLKQNPTLQALKKMSEMLDESEIKAIDDSVKEGIKIGKTRL